MWRSRPEVVLLERSEKRAQRPKPRSAVAPPPAPAEAPPALRPPPVAPALLVASGEPAAREEKANWGEVLLALTGQAGGQRQVGLSRAPSGAWTANAATGLSAQGAQEPSPGRAAELLAALTAAPVKSVATAQASVFCAEVADALGRGAAILAGGDDDAPPDARRPLRWVVALDTAPSPFLVTVAGADGEVEVLTLPAFCAAYPLVAIDAPAGDPGAAPPPLA